MQQRGWAAARSAFVAANVSSSSSFAHFGRQAMLAAAAAVRPICSGVTRGCDSACRTMFIFFPGSLPFAGTHLLIRVLLFQFCAGVRVLCWCLRVPADQRGVSPAGLLPTTHHRDGVALRLCWYRSADCGVLRAGHVLCVFVSALLAQLLPVDNHQHG